MSADFIEEVQMPEPRSWGVIWSEAIPHSAGFRCESSHCSWILPMGMKAYEYLVGFELGIAINPALPHRLILGKLIFECPICFEKFWTHACQVWVDQAMEICPNWPK